MKLELYRNLWGVEGPRSRALARIEAGGYNGIEAALFDDPQARELREVLPRHRLYFKAVLWPSGSTIAEQMASLHVHLERAMPLEPQSLSVIGGYDCWTDDEAARYFEAILKLEQQTGFSLPHETHRNSILFHPGVTLRLLDRFPEMKLVCDFSHWVVACERLLDDQLEAIRRCGRHAVHIHVRVGSEQAPQLADIRAPEAAPYRDAFERWWEIVWEEQAARGLAATTICPELGPPPYQPTLPYGGVPIADLEEQCEWQKQRQAARFAAWHARCHPREKPAPEAVARC
jgi:sugar phosphate isomerase/epimerase